MPAQAWRSKWSECSAILPSRNTKVASMRLCTCRPVWEKVYQASQWARPEVSSASMPLASMRRSLARSVSMRHMAKTSSPFRRVNTASENATSGA